MQTPWLLGFALIAVLAGMGMKVRQVLYPETPSAFIWGLNGIAVLAVLMIFIKAGKSMSERRKENKRLKAMPLSQKAGKSALGQI